MEASSVGCRFMLLVSFRWGVCGTAGGADRHREADADEGSAVRRVCERGDDSDHLPATVEQRPPGVARIDGGIELDEAVQGLTLIRLGRSLEPGHDTGGEGGDVA